MDVEIQVSSLSKALTGDTNNGSLPQCRMTTGQPTSRFDDDDAWARLRGGSMLVMARRLLQHVPGVPFDINRLYFLEYRGLPPERSSRFTGQTGLEVRGASREDFARLNENDEVRRSFLRRLDSNDQCVLALAQGRIVGYQWFCGHPEHMEERYSLRIEVPTGSVYTYDAFILPEFRLTGIWVKFQSLYLRDLMRKLGKNRIITMVDRGNQLSLATHLRFGYRPYHKVFVLRLFGKSLFLERQIRRNATTSTVTLPPAVTRKTPDAQTGETFLAS
jgi:GNAT superfamily N-acetyltransferase